MARPQIQPGQHGAVSFSQLEDGRVRARTRMRRLDGVLKPVEAVGKSKAEASRKLNARLVSLVTETDPGAIAEAPAAFAEIATKWLVEVETKVRAEALARTTQAEYARIVRAALIPRFGDLTIDRLDARKVFDWYQQRTVNKPVAARSERVVLSQIMDLAQRLQLIERNPVLGVKTERRKAKPVWAPSTDDLGALIEAIEVYNNDPDRPGPKPSSHLLDVLTVMAGTGLRISEALGLRWEEDVFLDAEQPYIVVDGAVKAKGGPVRRESRTKSVASKRQIAIPAFVVAVLMRCMTEARQGAKLVFETRTGRPQAMSTLYRALRRVRDEAGLPDHYVPHAMRRSVGTLAARAIGIEGTAKVLGHASIDVTQGAYVARELMTPDVTDVVQAHWVAATEGNDVNERA